MSSQREPTGLVTPLLSLPFKAAGRSSVKVQAYVRVCSRCCLQFTPACPEPLTCHLTSAPRSPENEGEPGLSLCPSPCPASERAVLSVLEWVPATRQDSVPFNSKPSHTHSMARRQQIVCPGQLKKESSFLIFSRQDATSVKALDRMEKGQEC